MREMKNSSGETEIFFTRKIKADVSLLAFAKPQNIGFLFPN
jgi:hypothetical protein